MKFRLPFMRKSAKELGIVKERVALRGGEVMQKIDKYLEN